MPYPVTVTFYLQKRNPPLFCIVGQGHHVHVHVQYIQMYVCTLVTAVVTIDLL